MWCVNCTFPKRKPNRNLIFAFYCGTLSFYSSPRNPPLRPKFEYHPGLRNIADPNYFSPGNLISIFIITVMPFFLPNLFAYIAIRGDHGCQRQNSRGAGASGRHRDRSEWQQTHLPGRPLCRPRHGRLPHRYVTLARPRPEGLEMALCDLPRFQMVFYCCSNFLTRVNVNSSLTWIEQGLER